MNEKKEMITFHNTYTISIQQSPSLTMHFKESDSGSTEMTVFFEDQVTELLLSCFCFKNGIGSAASVCHRANFKHISLVLLLLVLPAHVLISQTRHVPNSV